MVESGNSEEPMLVRGSRGGSAQPSSAPPSGMPKAVLVYPTSTSHATLPEPVAAVGLHWLGTGEAATLRRCDGLGAAAAVAFRPRSRSRSRCFSTSGTTRECRQCTLSVVVLNLLRCMRRCVCSDMTRPQCTPAQGWGWLLRSWSIFLVPWPTWV